MLLKKTTRVCELAKKVISEQKTSETQEGNAKLNRELVNALNFCHDENVSPPRELVELIKRQFSVTGNPRKASRSGDARSRVIELLAKDPKLSSRKLARACGITVPTVSKWRRDAAFNEAVREEIEFQAEWDAVPEEDRRKFAEAIRKFQDAITTEES